VGESEQSPSDRLHVDNQSRVIFSVRNAGLVVRESFVSRGRSGVGERVGSVGKLFCVNSRMFG